MHILVCESGLEDSTIICAQRNCVASLQVAPHMVVLVSKHRFSPDVAGEANFKRHPRFLHTTSAQLIVYTCCGMQLALSYCEAPKQFLVDQALALLARLVLQREP